MKQVLLSPALTALLAAATLPAAAEGFSGPYLAAGAATSEFEGDVDVVAWDRSFSGASGISVISERTARGKDTADDTRFALAAGWGAEWKKFYAAAEVAALPGSTRSEAGALAGSGTQYVSNPFTGDSQLDIGVGAEPPAVNRVLDFKDTFSVRLKAGRNFGDRWLVFAGGGYSRTDTDITVSETLLGNTNISPTYVSDQVQLEGWSTLAGIEYAIGKSVSLRLEAEMTRYDGPAKQAGEQFPSGAPVEYIRAINYDTLDQTSLSLKLVYYPGK